MPMEYRFTRKYYCFWVLIYAGFFVGVVESCLEEERLGLLSIKNYFKLNGMTDTDDSLGSWSDDPESDCCSWRGVECNDNASRVTELSFWGLLRGPLLSSQRILNMSLFTPFKDLLSLDLSRNSFTDCYQNYDFKALKNLVTLDLSYSSFSSNIQPCLSTLTSLRSLNLLESFYGNPSVPDFKALKNLVTLDLSYNSFSSNIQLSLSTLTSLRSLSLRGSFRGNLSVPELGGLKKLEILDLRNNELTGNVLHCLGNMTSLKALSVAHNNLNGYLAQQGSCELKNLQELDISHNNLRGIIPPCLGNLTSLRIINLSFNKLEGDISSSPIFNLKDLQYIDLRDNLFEGQFSSYSIANFTNLKVLMLSCHSHKLGVHTQNSHDWLPTFQLKILTISNCKIDNIDQVLAHQTDLRAVDLSHNNLTGRFPNWLLENNTELHFLSLRSNSFTGQFHLSSNSSFVMGDIDVSNNLLEGELQQDIGYLFPEALALNLSTNAFVGRLPFSIGHMPELCLLDISNNGFSGETETTLVGLANLSNLIILAASNNTFHGQIPNSINMTLLRSLQLSGNQITGNLSGWISHCLSLQVLDISDNHISGEIPPSIGNLTSLDRTNMADNMLIGRIPCELAMLELKYLDLSHNSLSGPIPSCFNLSSLQLLNLEGNRLTGSIPETLHNSSGPDVLMLNIGNNYLSGNIPSWVGALSNLRVLLLGKNSLRGLIPHQLCQLNKLGILDLSYNSFSGPIPRCLGNVSFGKLTSSDFAYKFWGFSRDLFGPYFEDGTVEMVSYFRVSDFISLVSDLYVSFVQVVQVGFVTKTRADIYKGSILELMSGLDLSYNQLTGEIPKELGNLSQMRSLNLSYNQLTGFIPTTFGNLEVIESLDLSHNKLSGKIPSELIGLNFLSSFSVAYNNFSGRLPDRKWQFGTFNYTSYEGNPFLCGPPLVRSCNVIHDVPQSAPSSTDASEGKWYDIDPVSFTACFVPTYLVFLSGFASVLYINPSWRRRLFMLIENFIDECHFLAVYTIPKLFATLYR